MKNPNCNLLNQKSSCTVIKRTNDANVWGYIAAFLLVVVVGLSATTAKAASGDEEIINPVFITMDSLEVLQHKYDQEEI